MSYNSRIVREQGGSVITVASGGSLSVVAGGTISGAGTFALTGAVTATGGITAAGGVNSTSNITGASLTVAPGGKFLLGSNIQVMFAASAAAPSGLPVSASPGAVFFRSDGANSKAYINTSTGTAGSVWTLIGELT